MSLNILQLCGGMIGLKSSSVLLLRLNLKELPLPSQHCGFQVVNELRRTTYRPKMAILVSFLVEVPNQSDSHSEIGAIFVQRSGCVYSDSLQSSTKVYRHTAFCEVTEAIQ